MPEVIQRDLAPGEWAVLGLLAERPAHGFALAKALAARGELGEIWTLPRPLAYRALGVLTDRGLAHPVGTETGAGPARTIIAVTPAGRRELERWLGEPVSHVRDVRSLLLLKLVYLQRSGHDPRPLLERQRALLRPLEDAHRARLAGATGWQHTIELWRGECVRAVVDFTEKMAASTQPAARHEARGGEVPRGGSGAAR